MALILHGNCCRDKLVFVSGLGVLLYKVVLAGRNCAEV